jgi:RNA polymerase sigma-54 factor
LSVLKKIQDLDPPGVGARSLQECLLIQLKRKNNEKESIINSINLIENEFELFSKKKFSRITEKLNLSEEDLKLVVEEISKLNPKPGGSITSEFSNNTIVPDFILSIEDGNFTVELNKRNSPELRLSNSYKNILEGYKNDPKKTKSQNQTVQFLKQKLDSAKWFIEAIEQRHQTLFQTINAIVNFQKEYFLTGEEKNLKPMILKDIAEIINMDISTVSRVANSKYIDTPYGIKLLKSYFSEGMKNSEGDEISTIEIKKILKEIVNEENKNKPLSDIELSDKLSKKGYKVARRTVSKYREQLDISVARLRKEL